MAAVRLQTFRTEFGAPMIGTRVFAATEAGVVEGIVRSVGCVVSEAGDTTYVTIPREGSKVLCISVFKVFATHFEAWCCIKGVRQDASDDE